MARLYDPAILKQVQSETPSKKEAWDKAVKNTRIANAICAVTILGLLAYPLLIVNVWYMYLAAIVTVAIMLLSNIESAYQRYRNPILYSDLKKQYDELGEFLKEKGYLDS